MTNRTELFKIFDEITDKAFQIMEGKNSDYASDEDSLANFRSSEVLNVDPRKALLIRMLDKIKRQVNYIERGELSVDSAEDDIVDLINYSVLLHALNRENEFEEARDATKDKVPSFDEYVVDKIVECEDGYKIFVDGYEVHPKFSDDRVEGVYIDNDKIVKIRLDDGIVFKRKYKQEDKTREECLDEMTKIAEEMGEYEFPFERQEATEINEYDPKNSEIDGLIRKLKNRNMGASKCCDNDKEYLSREEATEEYGLCNCKTKDTVGIKHGTEHLYGELADKNDFIEVGNNVWKKEGDDSNLRWKLTKAGFQPLHETGRSMGI